MDGGGELAARPPAGPQETGGEPNGAPPLGQPPPQEDDQGKQAGWCRVGPGRLGRWPWQSLRGEGPASPWPRKPPGEGSVPCAPATASVPAPGNRDHLLLPERALPHGAASGPAKPGLALLPVRVWKEGRQEAREAVAFVPAGSLACPASLRLRLLLASASASHLTPSFPSARGAWGPFPTVTGEALLPPGLQDGYAGTSRGQWGKAALEMPSGCGPAARLGGVGTGGPGLS